MSPLAKKTIKLVKGCMANERSAQEGLYKQFYADMLRLCIRYLKTNALAKEALNQGFLKTFQNINSFDDKKGELNAWIATIMIRTCKILSVRNLSSHQTLMRQQLLKIYLCRQPY